MEMPGIDPWHLLIYTMDYKKDRAEENEKGIDIRIVLFGCENDEDPYKNRRQEYETMETAR